MKKSVLVLGLVGILTVGGTVLAFADSATEEKGINGATQNKTTAIEALMETGVSFEDAKAKSLETKYQAVDKKVELGEITVEEGQEIKDTLKARTDACTTPGENRGSEDCGLNLGLGNGQGKGLGNGQGNGNGLKNGQCR